MSTADSTSAEDAAHAAQTVYEAAGGKEGMLALAHAWHDRVLADPVVSHPFERGTKPDHTERLAAYWGQALGGPPEYTERYADESTVVRIHSGNGPHGDMNDRAVACFDQALTDTGLAANEPLRQVLHDYFAWASYGAMAAYPDSADEVPDGLPFPRWSWDGPVQQAGPMDD